MDHRCDPRKAANIEVAIHCRWGTVGGHALNLSRGGVFVELGLPVLDISGGVEMTLVMPNQETGALRLFALVAHATPNGVGLMFLHDDHEISRLCAAVADSAPSDL